MLTEYEEKRLEYNLALNELNKLKKDYENKRIEMTKKNFNSVVKEKEKKVLELKQVVDDFFSAHQDEIVLNMLKNNLNISDDYEFYNSDISKDESGSVFVLKKTKDEIINEFAQLHNKVQKRYEDKVITTIIYNDVNRCLDLYQDKVISKWSSLSKKKVLDVEQTKEIVKNNQTKKTDENWFFVRVMLPIIIIDIICAIFMLFNGAECEIGSSEALSAFLCSFTVVSNLVVIFVTPVVVIYLLVKGVKVIQNRKKK